MINYTDSVIWALVFSCLHLTVLSCVIEHFFPVSTANFLIKGYFDPLEMYDALIYSKIRLDGCPVHQLATTRESSNSTSPNHWATFMAVPWSFSSARLYDFAMLLTRVN